jgi:hypothetical protein
MAAALPYVDALFAFAGPADVREVARQLERHGPGGPVGFEHDFRDRRNAERVPATVDADADADADGPASLRDRFDATTPGGDRR